MSEGKPPDDDIGAFLGWAARTYAGSPRTRVERGPERRVRERRALGYTARRENDADLNRKSRQFLFAWLNQLPRDRLMLWLDGVILGNLTDAQLAILVETVEVDNAAETQRTTSKRTGRGRPRDTPSPSDEYWRTTWHALRDELRTVSRARRNHFGARHRKGSPRRIDFRGSCRATPIGQRVEQAGLFDRFFDDPAMTPSEMAARLIHREIRQHLSAAARTIRKDAEASLSDSRRDQLLRQAARIDADLKALGSPLTLHRKLQRRS